MHGANEIILEATALPVEKRALVVDSLLRTLNAPDAEIDSQWAAVARHRLEELRAGRVEPFPGDRVFAKAQERLGR